MLIVVEHYLPGFKAGGPLRSISGLVAKLSDEFDFRVVTRCHDDGEREPYRDVPIDRWSSVGDALVLYGSRSSLTMAGLAKVVRQVSPDIVYLNSYFGPLTIRLLAVRWLHRLPGVPIILAPRGELSPGALRLKRTKKALFRLAAATCGLYDRIVWQASSALEETEIRQAVGTDAIVKVAVDMFTKWSGTVAEQRPAKRRGAAHFVFLSRIDRKKNLAFALEQLALLVGDITMDIYGPIGDSVYWHECEELIARMPASVQVTYGGVVPHSDVSRVLGRSQFFILPTRGENFGHAIVEALVAGCPVIISDRTPWLDLHAQGAGWDLSLDAPESWHQVLQGCVDMDSHSFELAAAGTRRLSGTILSTDTSTENRRLFRAMSLDSRDAAGLWTKVN